MMAELLRRLGQRLGTWSQPGSAGGGRSEIASSDSGWTLHVPLAGFDPDNVKITVTGDTIDIRGYQVDDGMVMRYDEMLTMPDWVDAGRITASFRHGMLEISLPAKDTMKPRRVEIVSAEKKQLAAA